VQERRRAEARARAVVSRTRALSAAPSSGPRRV